MTNLDQLRTELARLDDEIIRLAAHRRQLARQVGQAKDQTDRPLRDFAQEREVHNRAARAARAHGLPLSLARAVTNLLIQDALTVQERGRVTGRAGGAGKRALVIGGSGRMGNWMARFLDSQGYDVEVADPIHSPSGFPTHSDWRELTLDQDLIIVAAPLRQTAAILNQIGTLPPPRGVIADIGSLKSPLVAPLEALAARGSAVTSLHPMFGPDTEVLSGSQVIVVDFGNPAANQTIQDLFASTMAEVIVLDPDSHDRAIAWVLGLSHALNISFGAALARGALATLSNRPISSTTFSLQSEVAGRLSRENPRLYFEIQSLNNFGMESLESLVHAVTALRDTIQAGDEAGFIQLMDSGREFFENQSSPPAAG